MNADVMELLKRYALPATIVIVLLIAFALGGWFFYLHQEQSAIDTVAAGRGLGDTAASGFPVGSAYTNVVNAIASVFGGGQASSTAAKATGAAPQLWEVATAPIAGIAWTDATGSPVAEFMDQASGNVFDADPQTSSIVRRTNTLVPKIHDATWAGNGAILARYTDEEGIETLSGTISAAQATTSLGASTAATLESAGPGTFGGAMLPRGIMALAANSDPSSNEIFYLSAYNGGVSGTIAKTDGSNASRIWESSLSDWNVAWAGNHIVLAQKGSNGIPGTAYDLSLAGTISPLVNSQPGLSVKENPKTGAVLYSTVAENSAPKLYVEKNGAITSLPFSTLADKCVWSTTQSTLLYCGVPATMPSGALPDAWYRGEAHFADSWWQFDTATGAVAEVYGSGSTDRSLDILDPVMSPDGTYIAFTDAASGTGWVLRVNK